MLVVRLTSPGGGRATACPPPVLQLPSRLSEFPQHFRSGDVIATDLLLSVFNKKQQALRSAQHDRYLFQQMLG
jgi:hypothetical protein